MKKLQKILCFLTALLLLPTLFAGCGAEDDPFQVLFCAPYVNMELAEAYGSQITLESDTPVKYAGFTFGSEDVDPLTYGASAMMMNAMVAAGEVDVMVCDLAEAARYARGGIFYDLTEIFTQEELAEVSDRLVDFDMMDEYGVPTGERTALCGLDVSGTESLDYILAGGSYGIFIVSGAEDLELAKEIFWQIAGI